ncbi:UDP-glycosyltransferase 88F3-like protein [Drosera capensis]
MSAGTIVLYPCPGVGHMISMVELGNLIHRRYHDGFSIVVLLTHGFQDDPNIDAFITGSSRTNPSLSFLRLPHVLVDIDPTRGFAMLCEFLRLNVPHVIRSLNEIAQTSTIKSFIVDFFCTSALTALNNSSSGLKFPTYYFFTSGAVALVVYLYMPTIHRQMVETKSFKDMTDAVLKFPGLPPIPATYMPEPLLNRNDPAYDNMIHFSEQLPKSDGIIVNTFDELEPVAMVAIKGGSCVPGSPTPSIYDIGPLIRGSGGDEDGSKPRHECLRWLDLQPTESVVFMCFGSRGSFEWTQIREMADGLEKSGRRYLWAFKKSQESDVGLKGFAERTKGRGLVVGWVPQVEALNHDSVGGFVTHCGWNSVLEAVVAGKPMVAWPLYAEQHVNKAALVADDMGLAVPVEAGEDGLVSGDELARAISELMDSQKGSAVRDKCKAMKQAALAATSDHGSSTANLAGLVSSWM